MFDQAVRIHTFGETPPERCPYLKFGGIQFLQGMDSVLGKYPELEIRKLPAPHRFDTGVWSKRPLSADCIAYAAADVQINNVLLGAMRLHEVSELLLQGVYTHSKRYEDYFRNRELKVNHTYEKDFILEEHAIVNSNNLPANHPHEHHTSRFKGKMKWDDTVKLLQSGDFSQKNKSKAFNNCLFFLQHNDWYTTEGFDELRRLARDFPFNPK